MKENISGTIFASHLETGIFNRFLLELQEDVDANLLALAYRMTLIACPYFERTIVKKNGRLLFAPDHNRCVVMPLSAIEAEEGRGPVYGKNLVQVFASENKIITGISHALTDGYGKGLFNFLLMYHYFCLKDDYEYINPYFAHATRRIEAQMDLDVFADHLTPEIEAMPKDCEMDTCFHLPEKKEAGESAFLIEADYDRFQKLFHELSGKMGAWDQKLLPLGGSICLTLSYLMAYVIAGFHPENQEPISCRFPVNCRSLLGAEKSMRNFSHPQAVASFQPQSFGKEVRDALEDTLLTEGTAVLRQLSPECIGWQYSQFWKIIHGEKTEPAMDRRRDRTMLISNVGMQYFEPHGKSYVKRVQDLYGHFMLAIYLSGQGKKQVISIHQMFSSDKYAKGLANLLHELGLDVSFDRI